MSILNLNMLKCKCGGAEEPIINNVYKIGNRTILNVIFEVRIDRNRPQYDISTESDYNTTWRQVSSGSHMVNQQRHMPSREK